MCGLAVLLHGSFSNKCQLLFQVFNIHGDEGKFSQSLSHSQLSLPLSVTHTCTHNAHSSCLISLYYAHTYTHTTHHTLTTLTLGISREELATMLHAILQSTNTIVMAVSQMGGGAVGGASRSAVMEGENREQAIRSMVDSAFRNCDITGTGKLLPLVRIFFLCLCLSALVHNIASPKSSKGIAQGYSKQL